MKENIREIINIDDLKIKALLREIAKQAASLLAGFLMSRGVVFGEIMPFGLAFTAAVPIEYLATAAFGCFIGYMLPLGELNYFRYLAALFAIVAVKAMLVVITKLSGKAILSAITAFAITCVTGLVSSSPNALQMIPVQQALTHQVLGNQILLQSSVRLQSK